MDNYMGAYNVGGQAMPSLLSSHVFENKLSKDLMHELDITWAEVEDIFEKNLPL